MVQHCLRVCGVVSVQTRISIYLFTDKTALHPAFPYLTLGMESNRLAGVAACLLSSHVGVSNNRGPKTNPSTLDPHCKDSQNIPRDFCKQPYISPGSPRSRDSVVSCSGRQRVCPGEVFGSSCSLRGKCARFGRWQVRAGSFMGPGYSQGTSREKTM